MTTSPGLPNRELFSTGSKAVLGLAKSDAALRPTVMVIDLDRFKQVNDSVGIAVGDSILLTSARRLGRLIKPHGYASPHRRRSVRSSSFCRSAIRPHHCVC